MSKLFERLVEKRDFGKEFLKPRYEDLKDPFSLPDMKKATERIKVAIGKDEKVLIYGDYDVDGVTASAVMEQALILAGVKPDNIEVVLPNRFVDGYGMSETVVNLAKERSVKLIITVDSGSRNHEIVDKLKKNKIDCIVTDHHEVGETLPGALAVVNPKRKDFKDEDLRNLAGVGVAFKLAQALVKEKMIEEGQEKWLLDLVLIGTVCDNMTLRGENHLLGYFGLKVLLKTRRLGLRELMKSAGINKMDSFSIGFQIGPRLNAAGRLETAEMALRLILAKDRPTAAALAAKLEELNKKRKNEQNVAAGEIEKREQTNEPVIVEVGKWHEGILGIVAGRIVERYFKPTFLLAEVESGVLKGSGRSFGEFNLAFALEELKDFTISGGGHAAAAGVKLKKEKLEDFRAGINRYYKSLGLKDQRRFLRIEPDLEVEDLTEFDLEFLNEMKILEPFGPGNREPRFLLKNVVVEAIYKMGTEGQHLRIDVKDKNGKILKMVAFFAPEEWREFMPGDEILPVVGIVENEFRGVLSIEARLYDIIEL